MVDSLFNIRNFIHEMSDIPVNDMLCSVNSKSEMILTLDLFPIDKTEIILSGKLKSIVKSAIEHRKESDVNSLCAVNSVIEWIVDGKELQTPLLLFPLDWSVNKQKNMLVLQADDVFEVNPFVKFVFRNWTNREIDFDHLSIEETLKLFAELKDQNAFEFKIVPSSFIGNFHYHRFHILRELEGIDRSDERSELLNVLLGHGSKETEGLDLSNELLIPADVDQLNVFRSFEKNNIVVQGPPGTGKSQVLVNLLGKLTNANLKSLVVSEKKVALEVLTSKLASLGLSQFAFVVHSNSRSRDLLNHLKSTWSFLEKNKKEFKPTLRLSEQRLSQLQNLLDLLNTDKLVAGVSYNQFIDLVTETPLQEFEYRSDTPDIASWISYKETVKQLNESLGDLSFASGFKPSFFSDLQGDRKLSEVQNSMVILQKELQISTLQELERAYSSIGRCQLVENENFKVYYQLISKPRELKKYHRNALRFKNLFVEIEILRSEIGIWKTAPSSSLIESYQKATGFWRKRQLKSSLKKRLSDKSIDLEIAVSKWKEFLNLQKEHSELANYFEELGIDPSPAGIELGGMLLQSLESENQTVLSEVNSWNAEKRKALIKYRSEVELLYKSLIRYFELDPTADLLVSISEKQKVYDRILVESKRLSCLPVNLISLFEITGNWKTLQSLILFCNWRKTEALFPMLNQFTIGDLLKKTQQLNQEQDADCQSFAQSLVDQQIKKFNSKNQLLLKASQKCTLEERDYRAKLKRGKALLVKEFGKSRNHITIRELLASDAFEWINDILPIWLATPTQVADHFPLKTALFDVAIFDEASQIPLPNAFGTLFRSKRALVAGDEQQMSPTVYFGKKWTGHDLLHQALYYFNRVPLKHHYRSEYLDLISFSNKHFYNNELVVFPSWKLKQVIFDHFVENAVFHERKNVLEAEAVSEYLRSVDWNLRIGIVAFSEEQLKLIWNACDTKIQDLITSGQENGTVFFKSLEQVQGDEADILIIALGYGKNENGEFHLRFGPLNQANGYKRLNVLLTRATREMHLFRSIKSADFGMSANESVDLLRRFLLELESNDSTQKISFPYNLEEPVIEGQSVTFNRIASTFKSAQELATFVRVLEHRQWKLQFNS